MKSLSDSRKKSKKEIEYSLNRDHPYYIALQVLKDEMAEDGWTGDDLRYAHFFVAMHGSVEKFEGAYKKMFNLSDEYWNDLKERFKKYCEFKDSQGFTILQPNGSAEPDNQQT